MKNINNDNENDNNENNENKKRNNFKFVILTVISTIIIRFTLRLSYNYFL